MGRFFYYSHWHAEANAYYREIARYGDLALEPAYFFALVRLCMGEVEAARAIADRFARRAGATPVYMAGIAELYALSREEQKAGTLIEQGRLLDSNTPLSYFRKARLSLALQQPAQALAFLQSSLTQREPELPWIAADPLFDSIRHEAAFRQVHAAVYPS